MEEGRDGAGPGCCELGRGAVVNQSVTLYKPGGFLQLREDPVEGCAGAACGGECQPGSFVGHCGRREIGYRLERGDGGVKEICGLEVFQRAIDYNAFEDLEFRFNQQDSIPVLLIMLIRDHEALIEWHIFDIHGYQF